MTIKAAQYVPQRSQEMLLAALEQLRFAWTKNERWRYEDEYRLIAYKGGGKYSGITPARISAIYIGDKVSAKAQQEILKILDKSSRLIPIFNASVSKSAYGMTFSRLS